MPTFYQNLILGDIVRIELKQVVFMSRIWKFSHQVRIIEIIPQLELTPKPLGYRFNFWSSSLLFNRDLKDA